MKRRVWSAIAILFLVDILITIYAVVIKPRRS